MVLDTCHTDIVRFFKVSRRYHRSERIYFVETVNRDAITTAWTTRLRRTGVSGVKMVNSGRGA